MTTGPSMTPYEALIRVLQEVGEEELTLIRNRLAVRPHGHFKLVRQNYDLDVEVVREMLEQLADDGQVDRRRVRNKKGHFVVLYKIAGSFTEKVY